MTTKGSKASRQKRADDPAEVMLATGEQPASKKLPDAAAAPPPPAAKPVTAETSPPSPADISTIDLRITVIKGGLTNIKVPVVIGARYDGLAFAGATKAFDRLLDSWLTRAVDMGIIGSSLGQLFLINLEQFQRAGRIKADNLLLAGMGEPGRFARDSLQFLISNVVVGTKVMGHGELALPMLGIRRSELTVADAVRGLVAGIHDGYERLRAMADDDANNREALRNAAAQPLSVIIAHPELDKSKEIEAQLGELAQENPFPNVTLTIHRGPDVEADPIIEPSPVDVEPDQPVNYLRIIRSKSAAAAMRGKSVFPAKHKKPAAHRPVEAFMTDVFQFSALSEVSVISLREQEVNSRILRDLVDHMTKDCALKKREDLGAFFTNILIPDDFRKLTEGSVSLTLEVDDATAAYPWEMATNKRFTKASFLSTNVAVSRQFRSVLSPPPVSPPALNNRLKALIIADPASDDLALPHARAEGAAVVEVLERARKAWGGQYDITARVRIGPCGDEAGRELLDKLKAQNICVVDAEPCQPLELAMLIVNEQFDLIHYAGHGISDPKTGRTGWVFAGDCILSAKDIFRVRQVPRLVFANACFSAATSDYNKQREHMTGLAQAFFARGIPNFIGAGWEVDDACAEECARWFYARVMGLSSPNTGGSLIGTAPPATIGEALKKAREMALIRKPRSPSWGAYQHYGHVSDKLVAMSNAPLPIIASPQTAADAPFAVNARTTLSTPSTSGVAKMAASEPSAGPKSPDPNLVYVNGIDFDTGEYAFKPRSIDDLAKQVLAHPGADRFGEMHGDKPRSFALPFDMDPNKLDESGWGVIFHTDTPQKVRDALEPLIALRRTQAGERFKALDYKKGEQARDWYGRHGLSPGAIDPMIVPYYLLLVGPPELIPFEFQYLLGVDYAIGRLSFDTPEGYERYARSTVAYESAKPVPNGKEIAYWGTRHLGDAATELSASMLVDPLANGIAGATGALKQAVSTQVGYDRKLRLGDDATKDSLLETLHAKKPPAMLFTASHGMALRSGQTAQATTQGALLCQDWPGFGSVRKEHFLAATDIADDANVNGVVALLFACFGAGAPDADQFLMDLSQASQAPPLAPKPFIAALPQRLLAHPNGSALAVIGHIDRAWGCSIRVPNVSGPQIGTFRNSIGTILSGGPVGHAICGQFGAKFSALSVLLLSATSPTAANATRLSDRELVTRWLERNDAQNYVLLGDPAVRIRNDALA
jgi:hypothetical protein